MEIEDEIKHTKLWPLYAQRAKIQAEIDKFEFEIQLRATRKYLKGITQ